MTCTTPGCTRKAACKGLCYTHYHEVYGEPYRPKRKNRKGGNIKIKEEGER